MSEIQIMEDYRQDIQFWLDALSNPNIERETKELLNKCLRADINKVLYPMEYVKMYMGVPF